MDSVKEDGNGRQNGWPVFLQTVCLSVIHSDSHTAWHPLSTMSSAELHPTWWLCAGVWVWVAISFLLPHKAISHRIYYGDRSLVGMCSDMKN